MTGRDTDPRRFVAGASVEALVVDQSAADRARAVVEGDEALREAVKGFGVEGSLPPYLPEAGAKVALEAVVPAAVVIPANIQGARARRRPDARHAAQLPAVVLMPSEGVLRAEGVDPFPAPSTRVSPARPTTALGLGEGEARRELELVEAPVVPEVAKTLPEAVSAPSPVAPPETPAHAGKTPRMGIVVTELSRVEIAQEPRAGAPGPDVLVALPTTGKDNATDRMRKPPGATAFLAGGPPANMEPEAEAQQRGSRVWVALLPALLIFAGGAWWLWPGKAATPGGGERESADAATHSAAPSQISASEPKPTVETPAVSGTTSATAAPSGAASSLTAGPSVEVKSIPSSGHPPIVHSATPSIPSSAKAAPAGSSTSGMYFQPPVRQDP